VGDEARSDLALAIAAAAIGPALLGPVTGGGALGAIGGAAALLAVTALVPVLLGRARGDLTSALALRSGGGLPAGLPLAVPAAVAGAVAMVTAGAAPSDAALGRLSGSVLQLLVVGAAATGAAVLVTFLAVRARAASVRSPVWSLRRLLRTVGAGAAAVGLVTGLLRVPLGASGTRVVVNAVALVATVLLADRLVGDGGAPRLAVLLPAGLVAWLHVSALGFGAGLTGAALGAGTAAVIATVALGPHGLRAVVPLAVAVHLWPTCLSPLAQVGGLC
jgi:hypothetical protein